jgi:hypothetical protein
VRYLWFLILFLTVPAMGQPVLDKKFVALTAAHAGLAALDVALTHRCEVEKTCREGNPFMPQGLRGQIAVDSAWVGLGTVASWKLKKRGSKLWIISPLVGIGTHVLGISVDLRLQK